MISCKYSTNINSVIDWLVKHSNRKSWMKFCHAVDLLVSSSGILWSWCCEMWSWVKGIHLTVVFLVIASCTMYGFPSNWVGSFVGVCYFALFRSKWLYLHWCIWDICLNMQFVVKMARKWEKWVPHLTLFSWKRRSLFNLQTMANPSISTLSGATGILLCYSNWLSIHYLCSIFIFFFSSLHQKILSPKVLI